jgi:hypothetical protein
VELNVKSMSCHGIGFPARSVRLVISMFNDDVAFGIFTGGSLVHSYPNVQLRFAGDIAGDTVKIEAETDEQELSLIAEEKLFGVVYVTV